jgi:hypothetical protein
MAKRIPQSRFETSLYLRLIRSVVERWSNEWLGRASVQASKQPMDGEWEFHVSCPETERPPFNFFTALDEPVFVGHVWVEEIETSVDAQVARVCWRLPAQHGVFAQESQGHEDPPVIDWFAVLRPSV